MNKNYLILDVSDFLYLLSFYQLRLFQIFNEEFYAKELFSKEEAIKIVNQSPLQNIAIELNIEEPSLSSRIVKHADKSILYDPRLLTNIEARVFRKGTPNTSSYRPIDIGKNSIIITLIISNDLLNRNQMIGDLLRKATTESIEKCTIYNINSSTEKNTDL